MYNNCAVGVFCLQQKTRWIRMLCKYNLREIDGVFVGEIGDDLGREEFGAGCDALGMEVGGVGLEPAAEGVGRNACESGEL